jgi:hypothetical protein
MTIMIAVEIRNRFPVVVHRVHVEGYRNTIRFQGFWNFTLDLASNRYILKPAKERRRQRMLIQYFWVNYEDDWQMTLDFEKRAFGDEIGPYAKAPIVEHPSVIAFFEYVGYNSKSRKLQSWTAFE